MDAVTLFENTMDWLRLRGTSSFQKEEDIKHAANARIKGMIAEDGLPYSVAEERPLIRRRADLVIFGADASVLVAVEFKFEPPHNAAMGSDDVLDWREAEEDIGKSRSTSTKEEWARPTQSS